MDCVQGMILLNYLKENPQIEKRMMLSWFRELAVSVDQYHRSHGRQNYRYLNPCSIVVSEEENLFLLDMEAPDNEPVMKRMQKRAVRNHFVKPIYEIGAAGNNDAEPVGGKPSFRSDRPVYGRIPQEICGSAAGPERSSGCSEVQGICARAQQEWACESAEDYSIGRGSRRTDGMCGHGSR